MTSPFSDIDPYDGKPVNADRGSPKCVAESSVDMTREPVEVVTSDEAGFIKSRKPAPVYRCFTCGAETTRRVCVAVYRTSLHAGEQQFRGEYRAECRACALIVAGREEAHQ